MGSKGHCILPLLQHKQYLKIGPTEKKKRGRTQMQRVYGRTECRLIVLNEHNQPIGPTLGVVQELSSFLGTLARNSTFCPLTLKTWKKVNTKKDMWNYIKKTSHTNTENRKKLRYPRTIGKKSFAVIREAEMEKIQSQEIQMVPS